MIEKLIAVASAELGTKENPPGSNNVNEEWRPVVGWEGLYEVSNCGRVRSLDRYKTHYRGGLSRVNGVLLIPIIRESNARRYPTRKPHPNAEVNLVDSCGGRKRRACKIHRLVAEAFIPNPDKLSEINHKDENSLNNHVDNLEWCTSKYNANYGTCKERISETRMKRGYLAKQIVGVNLKTGTTVSLPSVRFVDLLGLKRSSVYQVIRGTLKTNKGYTWRYADEPDRKSA